MNAKVVIKSFRWGLWCVIPLLLGGCGGGAEDEIIRVSRQNNSGTYAYFREAVLGEDREFKLGSIDLSGSKDVVELVSKTPNAIGYSGMGYATDEVKMLKISQEKGSESVAPTIENAKSGRYPLARPLYLYTVGEPTGAIAHFVQWIRSEEGQKVVSEEGYVPLEPQEAPADAPREASIKIAGSDTMLNVAIGWQEEYRKKYPNVNIQVSGGGSGTGIAMLTDGTIDVANASREMKPDEREVVKQKRGDEPVEHTVGLDALAVYVHKENPLEEISIPELAEIYGQGSNITRWSQLDGWPRSEVQAGSGRLLIGRGRNDLLY